MKLHSQYFSLHYKRNWHGENLTSKRKYGNKKKLIDQLYSLGVSFCIIIYILILRLIFKS